MPSSATSSLCFSEKRREIRPTGDTFSIQLFRFFCQKDYDHTVTHEKLQLNATFDFGRCWIQRLLKRGAGAWSSFWLIDWCGSPPRCRRRIDGVFRSWIKESRDCQHPSKQSHSVHQWSEQLFLLVCTAKMTSMMSLLWFCSPLHCSARG